MTLSQFITRAVNPAIKTPTPIAINPIGFMAIIALNNCMTLPAFLIAVVNNVIVPIVFFIALYAIIVPKTALAIMLKPLKCSTANLTVFVKPSKTGVNADFICGKCAISSSANS